jgi:hypothetical protein
MAEVESTQAGGQSHLGEDGQHVVRVDRQLQVVEVASGLERNVSERRGDRGDARGNRVGEVAARGAHPGAVHPHRERVTEGLPARRTTSERLQGRGVERRELGRDVEQRPEREGALGEPGMRA